MKKLFGDVGISQLPNEIRTLWYTRNDEPAKEEFCDLPEWMAQEVTDGHESRNLSAVMAYLLTTITKREALVLLRRFWIEETLEEAAIGMGVTRERIRQIECKAIRKLRHPCRADLIRLAVDLPEQTPKISYFSWDANFSAKLRAEFIESIRVLT